MAGDKKSLHPAFVVTNIKTLISILLHIKQDEYSSWVFLFELHLQAHGLLFLIDGTAPPTEIDKNILTQLDALCRQWMFSTMAKDLMLTVLKSGKTARALWDHLQNLFQDNKGNRAATLESKFFNLKFVDCASIDDYCDKLKSLSDRLTDLDFPMNDKRLVIQLVNGLSEEYNIVASFIQQFMPTFDAARSQLRTEEICRTQQTSMASSTALAATGSSTRQRPQRSGYNKRNQHHQRPQTQQLSAEPPLLPIQAQFRQPNNPPSSTIVFSA
ncbi:uncharacterized protein LOC113337082 [Papaver somniferum]|uniref:uncharacterized protein LOC113337082 n=1 Tax=Papaver somniferum TaxID=3469 RepID=UPI000E70501B|nr:uncharacterized protein LOC113337082 [Papaver somniferum]